MNETHDREETESYSGHRPRGSEPTNREKWDKTSKDENANKKNEGQYIQATRSRRPSDSSSQPKEKGNVEGAFHTANQDAKHGRKVSHPATYGQNAKAKHRLNESGKRNMREDTDETRTGNQTRTGHSSQRPSSEARQGNVHSDRTSHDGRVLELPPTSQRKTQLKESRTGNQTRSRHHSQRPNHKDKQGRVTSDRSNHDDRGGQLDLPMTSVRKKRRETFKLEEKADKKEDNSKTKNSHGGPFIGPRRLYDSNCQLSEKGKEMCDSNKTQNQGYHERKAAGHGTQNQEKEGINSKRYGPGDRNKRVDSDKVRTANQRRGGRSGRRSNRAPRQENVPSYRANLDKGGLELPQTPQESSREVKPGTKEDTSTTETSKREDKDGKKEGTRKKEKSHSGQSTGCHRPDDCNKHRLNDSKSQPRGKGKEKGDLGRPQVKDKHRGKADEHEHPLERAKTKRRRGESGKRNKRTDSDNREAIGPTPEDSKTNVDSDSMSQGNRSVRPKVTFRKPEQASQSTRSDGSRTKTREGKSVSSKSSSNHALPDTDEAQNSRARMAATRFKTTPGHHTTEWELHLKPRSNGSSSNGKQANGRRHRDRDHHVFRKSEKGDAELGLGMENGKRDQVPNSKQGRHCVDKRQYLYRVQLSHIPQVDTVRFRTVFATHPGFVRCSVEFNSGGPKGFVYFSTHKYAENFRTSVKTVCLPEKVARESVAKKTRQRTFEDKLVDLASQVDSGVRRLFSCHNDKVVQIKKKVEDLRPSGKFVPLDEYNVRAQQRKVLQMKQVELTKQKQEFEQSIKNISEELICLSSDGTTRSKLMRLLGDRLGGTKDTNIGCAEDFSSCSDRDDERCTHVSDPVQQGIKTDLIMETDKADLEPSTHPPTVAVSYPVVNKSSEGGLSLINFAEDQGEDSKTADLVEKSETAEDLVIVCEISEDLVKDNGTAEGLVKGNETAENPLDDNGTIEGLEDDNKTAEDLPEDNEAAEGLDEDSKPAEEGEDRTAKDLGKDSAANEDAAKDNETVEGEETTDNKTADETEKDSKIVAMMTTTCLPSTEGGACKDTQEKVENPNFLLDNPNVKSTLSPGEKSEILNNLKDRYLRECSRFQAALPMYAHRSDLLKEMRRSRVVVVVAETGSGKSTQIVQYLADDISEPGKLIACTQPRKIAAISLADRVAAEYGCRVGEQIGYAVGSKRRVSNKTKAVFMTDQASLNSFVKDGELDKYSCIIIDEAHERSIHTDLLLGMLKKSLQARPNLRLVIASATIDPTLFSNYFEGCPVMSVPGRTFPVEVIYKHPQFGDNSVDRVNETVTKVIEIHNNEAAGDVLAFLTSPLDIERACERTTYLLGSKVKSVLVLPLHGKLQPEDQRKVFEPAPIERRKIVFATNIAETSVTIPGIIYVVDSGMVKERYFDAKRNLSVLDVKMIARSSAIQRAGRAGRIQPGKCYRLYTEEEFDDMRASTPPEILRMHLGMAVLKLMELGVTDVADFDFVERPSDDALHDAIIQLDILGAVEKTEQDLSEKTAESKVNRLEASSKSHMTITTSIKLTDLGLKMSQLPTEPRLSKMILDGVDKGCGKEALLVAALVSAAGSIYFRAGTEEEKATADKQKMKFCHEGGDLLSMLDVYREWKAQPLHQRNKWCVANSINAKTMRLAEESFKDMKHQLASSGVHVPDDFAPVETVNTLLPRLIFGAYCNNLCVFSGHERAGYLVERLRQCVHVHPSSALGHLGAQHKWVVFDEILRTSRDFIINVTPVDITWLEDVAPCYAGKADLHSLELSTVVPCLIKGFGPEVVRGMIGRRGQTLKTLEAAVSDDGKHLCVIEVDTDRCQVVVFTSQDRLKDGEKIVRDAMDAKHNDLKNESDEIPVVDGRGSGTRMVLGKGAEVQDILLSSEFRRVDVFYTGGDAEGFQKAMDVFVGLEYLLIRTNLNTFLTTANSHKVGTLTFSSYRAAQDTVDRYDRQPFLGGTLVLKPVKTQSRSPAISGLQQAELNVTWFRRACRGFGFVDCVDEIQADRLCDDIDDRRLEGGNGIILANISKTNNSSVYVHGSCNGLNEHSLEGTVRRYSEIRPIKCSAIWKPLTGPVDTESEKARLEEIFSDYTTHGTLQVSVFEPNSERQVKGYAVVAMSDENEAQNAVEDLNGALGIMGTQILSVERKLQCEVACNAKIYEVLENRFRDVLEDPTQGRTGSVKAEFRRTRSGKTVYISVSGNDVEQVARAKSRLHDVMRPDTVTHEDPSIISQLFDKMGLDFIRTVRKQVKDVHIDVDHRTFTVSLYGNDEQRMEAKKRISDYLDSLTEHKPREIHLTGSSKPAGVMKALLNKYGLDLEGMKEETGAKTIRLDMRKHLLVVQESDETFNKVNGSVEECAKEILERKGERCLRVNMEDAEDDAEDCRICLCPIEGRDYRLQCCGHRYCHECIKLQLTTAIKSQEFPITCVSDGCGREIFLMDLRFLLNPAEFLQLVKASLNTFVNKSGGRYRPCPTPDCPSVYRAVDEKEKEGQVFQCCVCHKRLCTRCHVDMHDGMSCRTWQIFRSDPDDTLREWMKQKEHVKLCPKCNWVIEKNGGCNHIACNCGAHICWVCMETFFSSQSCYGHLDSAHGRFT